MKYKLLLFIGTCMIMIFNQNLKGQINSEELRDLVEQTRKKYYLPAIAVVIVNSNDIVLNEIKGVRVQNTKQEATLNDYFHIGSCSKLVLALIAGKLIEDGKINWDTPFFEIFPELKNVSHLGYNKITLEDLFLCKAGIKAFTSGTEKYPLLEASDANMKYRFAKYLLQQPPASKNKNSQFDFLYSNASYTIAALMLEKVSKLSYEELIDFNWWWKFWI